MSFGFGKKLGIDMPGELNGNIPSPAYYDKYHGVNRWRSMTIISLAIGQGEVGITPVQLANFSATIANRGWFYTPHLIRAIGKKDSLIKEFTTRHQVAVDPHYFDVVVEGMALVVAAGTATGICTVRGPAPHSAATSGAAIISSMPARTASSNACATAVAPPSR